MTEIVFDLEEGEPLVVDLREPVWAALLAWLWPGAGHFYQRRFAKGFLYMICVLSTFFLGLAVGRGRVVYVSFDRNDFRWQYICQAGAGIPSFPAVIQSFQTSEGGDPFFVFCERYPPNVGHFIPGYENRAYTRIGPDDPKPVEMPTYKDGFMAPPAGPITPDFNDVLGMWHVELKHYFEIGTLFTVVAGLLNLLAVYDAFAGPIIITPEERRQIAEKRKQKRRRKKSAES